MPHTTTQHQTPIQLPKVADRPEPRGAVGQSLGGGGAAGPLVGPAGVGSGAGGRGHCRSSPGSTTTTKAYFDVKSQFILKTFYFIELLNKRSQTLIKIYTKNSNKVKNCKNLKTSRHVSR